MIFLHNAKDKESFTLENDKEVPSRDVEAEQQTSDREITEEDIKAIFLRSNHSTPDKMSIIFEFENGLKIKNGIKVLKVSDYSINDTLEKKLYFLVPFLSFNDEKLLKDNKDDLSVIEKKLELYCDLMDKLKEAYTKGELSDKCYRYLVELFLKVLVNLVKKCYSILKGVSKMDVEIYRIPEQDLIDEAEARGKAIGEARGKAIGEARGKAIGEAEGEAITLINNTKTIITSNIDRNQKVSMILGFLSNVSDRTEAIRRLRSNVSGFNDIMEGYKLV